MWRQRWLNYSNKPAINMTIAVNALVTMKTMTNNHILPCGRALASHRLATEGKKWTENLICLGGVKLRLCIFTANVVSVLLRRLLFLVFLFLLLVFLCSLAHRKCSSPKWIRRARELYKFTESSDLNEICIRVRVKCPDSEDLSFIFIFNFEDL